MKFLNIDFHASVIEDVRGFLEPLGHTIDALSLSNHSWVFGKPKDVVPGLFRASPMAFGQAECDRFHEIEAERLEDYDGFIVTHSPCLAGLYERTGKPVICVVSTRYNTFCLTPASRMWLDDLLVRMHGSGQLTLLANNAYDAWHVHNHLGIMPEVVPSYCGYTGETWSGPKAPSFLHGRWPLLGLCQLRRGHSWQDVADAAACVCIPYNVSLMSIFERHTMGIPLVMPSREWLDRHPESLSQLRHYNKPTDEELQAALLYADWFCGELPGITFFDSEEHLARILEAGAPPVIGMTERKERIAALWKKLAP